MVVLLVVILSFFAHDITSHHSVARQGVARRREASISTSREVDGKSVVFLSFSSFLAS